MMARGEIGDQYEIGYSGPRTPGSCEEDQTLIRASFRLRYQFDLPDKDCVYHLRFGFKNIRSGVEAGSFEVEGTTDNDQTWHIYSGTMFVPYHVRLTIRAWLEQDSQGGSFPNCDSVFEAKRSLTTSN